MDTTLSRQAREDLFNKFRKEYQKASKNQKGDIINSLITSTGYSRKAIIRSLNRRHVKAKKKPARQRKSSYSGVMPALRIIWASANFICGKRLQSILPLILNLLLRFGELQVSQQDQQLLLSMSSASMDRLLKTDRLKMQMKGRSTTKPGTLLKHKIPIRTFADWNEGIPGFLEADLVGFCGDTTAGEYINTLTMTDIATGWVALTCFMGRSERFCVQAIEALHASLPFPLLGFDSDNDSLFINGHLLRYCSKHCITFTRSRPRKSNDSCFVEQKNWDVVRKNLGYARLDTDRQLTLMRQVLPLLALYQNCFQPSVKLASKHRIGSKVTRKYLSPETPLKKLIANPSISSEVKNRLLEQMASLNPKKLLAEIQSLVRQLYEKPIEP